MKIMQIIDAIADFCDMEFDWIFEGDEETRSGHMLYFDGGQLGRSDVYKLEAYIEDIYGRNYEVDPYAGLIILK